MRNGAGIESRAAGGGAHGGRQLGSVRARWLSPWATATKVAAVFVLPAVVAGWLGASDVSSALTFGGRIEGGFALAASVVLGFGIVSTFLYQRGSPHAGVVSLAAAIVAALVALFGLVNEAVQSERRWTLVVVCSLLLAAAGWAIWRLRHSGVRFPYPKSLAAAVVIPALLAVTNLVYSDVYQPSIAPRQISVTTSIGDPSMTPGSHEASLPVTIVFKNNSQNKVVVLMTTYSVIDWRNTAVGADATTRLSRGRGKSAAVFGGVPADRLPTSPDRTVPAVQHRRGGRQRDRDQLGSGEGAGRLRRDFCRRARSSSRRTGRRSSPISTGIARCPGCPAAQPIDILPSASSIRLDSRPGSVRATPTSSGSRHR